ncbi:MAG: BamA/TamA family outer membrane protein [Crocinitomicaceae bacterium]|nr:BamA/TamA family outer membrane protein [Crocinitomicaceae bacterium]
MQHNYHTYRFLLAIFALFTLFACSVNKYIPKDELLFRGGKVTLIDSVKIENKKGLKKELQSLLYPKPNSRFLGMYYGLYFHYKYESKEKPRFLIRFLNKKLGEKPAYFSSVRTDETEDLIENRLQNSGFFHSNISSTIIKDSSAKTAKTDYKVQIGKPYHLSNYTVEVDSIDLQYPYPVYDAIRKSLNETILKKGTRYDLGAFKAERNRIDQYLKKEGYYNFNSSFILFQADTNLNDNKQYNLYLKLKVGVPEKSKVPYILDRVDVYPNVAKDTSGKAQDTTTIADVNIIQNRVYFKPKRLRSFILLKPGQLYDPLRSKYTSQRISNIGAFKFVNIQYKEVEPTGIDSLQLRHLNAVISLSPMTKRSLRAELQGVTKSNNFTGPNVGLTLLNRNLFKGGETFSASGKIAYEKQFGNKTSGSSSLQMGLNASLLFPRLVFPGNLYKYFRYSIPKTKISVGADYYKRSKLYSLNSYSASFGYIWNANSYVTHQLNPIDLNYVQLGKRSQLFDSILDGNPFLKRSFEQQFIAGLTYTFIYNELNDLQKKGKLNIQFNFDLAGNTANLFGRQKEGDSIKTFLNLAYAQYVKFDLDFAYHYDIGRTGNVLVGRVFGGIGIPYGNSKTLPFVKQYYSGGSYSVRAFQIRGLGPGIYNPANENNLYLDRSGDIRLEGNFEYRFPIISVLKGAVFADAGNIWNLNDHLPGGKFTKEFTKQFGIGAGFGLRIDVQGFVIRFDLASPIKRPAAVWDFEWKNPVFNFAIGYPF